VRSIRLQSCSAAPINGFPIVATLVLPALMLAPLFVVPVTAAQTPAVRLDGRVLDVSGAVVPGVLVRLTPDGTARVLETSTDAEGRFSFDVVPGVYELTARAEGFSLAQVPVRVDARTAPVDLVLRPGALAEDLTVFGTRLAPSEEIRRRLPGAVDVLTADTLERSHVLTTSEALRKVPGLNVRDEEGLGLRPNIAVRGVNPTRSTKVLLLEDGVPTAYAPYGDNASYYHPPIERFERVEVLKGSSQIAYGPVTVGAVINYITPEPPARPTVHLALSGGSREFVNASVGAAGTWRSTGAIINVMRKESRGARDNVFSILDDVSAKVHQQVTPLHSLSGKVNYYGEDSQVTYSGLRADEYAAAPRQNPFVNDRFDGSRVGVSGAYRGLLGSRVAWTTTLYNARFDRDWWRQSSNSGQRPNDSSDAACGGMANLLTTCGNEGRLRSYRTTGIENRARFTLSTGRVSQETDAGFRYHTERQDRLQQNGDTPIARTGRTVEDNLRTTDAWSAYAQHHARWGALSMVPGLRVERVAYGRTNRLLGVSGKTTLTEWLPGLGVTVAPSPDVTVFGGVHRGFAPPRAEDIMSNTTGGVVDLDPERGWNTEIGVRSRLADGVTVDATFFRLDYENQIIPASVAGGIGATLTNGGETLHRGLEAGLSADTMTRLHEAHALYGRAALTWLPVAEFQGVRFSTVPGATTVSVSGNRLTYAPDETATITLGYRHRIGFDAQVEAQHIGDQFGDDLNTIDGTPDGQRGLLPGYTVWNAAATWRLPKGGSIFLAVKNLTDRTVIVDRVRGILPGLPRLVQVGTSWRF
jgi:Fe(3+) dicitrate transport protein